MSQISKVILVAMVLYLQGCVSTTRIVSSTPGAKVYVNGEYAGLTPYEHEDRRVIFSETNIKLQKPGYKPLSIVLKRNEELQVLPLVFGIIGLFPLLLWVMGYKPEHTYGLERNPSTDE